MTIRRLFALLFLLALVTMAVRETLDPDMWWHLRTGQVILEEGLPRQDIFSFTVPDHEWITHEWLSQVVMWLVYSLAGLTGLILFFAAITALTFWILFQCCTGRPYLAAFVVLLAAISSAVVWGARPQMFNLLLTAAFVYLVEGYRAGRISRRRLWLLPFLTLIWANLHSGYLLGAVLLATYAVGESLQRLSGRKDSLKRAQIWPLYQMTFLSFLAAVVNPSGPELWIYPFSTLGSNAMQAYIQEWHSPNFHLSFFWPFAAMIGLGVAGWLWGRRRPSWSDMLLFGGTAAAGLLSARHIPLFAIVSAPALCRAWTAAFDGTALAPLVAENSLRPAAAGSRLLNWLLLLLAGLAALLWTADVLQKNEAAVAGRYPVAAVDYLESAGLAEERGYNSYNWGGYLIWRGLPVFVDGRADVYGDAFLIDYRRTFDLRSDWREPLERFAIDYVLMERSSSLTTLLAADSGWKMVYQDDVAEIFVRVD